MIKKLIWLTLVGLMLAGCNLDKEQPQDKEKKAAEEVKARMIGEALNASQEAVFKITPEERRALEAGWAVNALGTPNGIFTNPDGVSGYFSGYSRPFNFIWKGKTVVKTAFDGRTYSLVDGPGEMVLKSEGDDLVLQRFKGEVRDGLWHGHGEYWQRNDSVDGGHNYLSYQGLFINDQMDGRGVLSSFDFENNGSLPYQYAGEFKNNAFYGQGLLTNLATGAAIFKGLWLEGQPFEGYDEEWQIAVAQSELKNIAYQFSGLLTTDQVEISGFTNLSQLSRGVLSIIMQGDFQNLKISDQTGRNYRTGEFSHPQLTNDAGQELVVFGSQQDIPRSDYPLNLRLTYDRRGQQHMASLTVKNPCVLVWTPLDGAEEGEEVDSQDRQISGIQAAVINKAKQAFESSQKAVIASWSDGQTTSESSDINESGGHGPDQIK